LRHSACSPLAAEYCHHPANAAGASAFPAVSWALLGYFVMSAFRKSHPKVLLGGFSVLWGVGAYVGVGALRPRLNENEACMSFAADASASAFPAVSWALLGYFVMSAFRKSHPKVLLGGFSVLWGVGACVGVGALRPRLNEACMSSGAGASAFPTVRAVTAIAPRTRHIRATLPLSRWGGQACPIASWQGARGILDRCGVQGCSSSYEKTGDELFSIQPKQ